MEIQFRYMEKKAKWTPIHKDARRIRAGWDKAFKALRYELSRIGATEVVLEAGYQHSQLRRDGLPISSAKAEHGQARVSFRKNGVPMAYFCGAWTTLEQNVYMIALTLERLRAINRYACTHGSEQYKGWAQLPPGEGAGGSSAIAAAEWASAAAEWASAADARKFLAAVGGFVEWDGVDLTDLYRAAAKKAHPDAGGSVETMAKVNRARAFIEKTRGAA